MHNKLRRSIAAFVFWTSRKKKREKEQTNKRVCLPFLRKEFNCNWRRWWEWKSSSTNLIVIIVKFNDFQLAACRERRQDNIAPTKGKFHYSHFFSKLVQWVTKNDIHELKCTEGEARIRSQKSRYQHRKSCSASFSVLVQLNKFLFWHTIANELTTIWISKFSDEWIIRRNLLQSLFFISRL